MNMDWVPYVIFLMGLLDAGLIMIGGFVLAVMVLFGKEVKQFWDRLAPSVGILIGTNIAAAIILAATRYLVS